MPDPYSPAKDVATIGEKLIKKHHDHLATRRVEFLYVERLDKDGNSQAITPPATTITSNVRDFPASA